MKIKLSEIAKELKVSSKELILKVNKFGMNLQQRARTVTEKQANDIRNYLVEKKVSLTESRKGDVLEKRVKRGIIRRRRVVEPASTKPVQSEVPPPVAAKPIPKPKEHTAATLFKSRPKSAPSKTTQGITKVKLVTPQKIVPPVKKASATHAPVASKAKSAGPTAEEKRAIEELAKRRRTAFIKKRAEEFDIRGFSRIERIYQPKRKRIIDKSRMKQTVLTTPKAEKRVINITGQLVVSELAKAMKIRVAEIVKKLMDMGTMVTATQTIDAETASILAAEYGFEIKVTVVSEDELLKREMVVPKDLKHRAPVVTVMGHVDHGKTTLLDVIRKADVASGEAGGITQHIGAYMVNVGKNKTITFIDTPGHEAFSAMRARGAKTTDIVILVVAADDGIMPQTKEAAAHAKDAGVPIIVAINKIDKPNAHIEKVKKGLADLDLLPEDWGGKTLAAEVSATKKTGIKELLELILLQADMLELKASPDVAAEGVVLEAHVEKGLGPVATVIVQKGTLHRGDKVVMGDVGGTVRLMKDDHGKLLKEAGPSFAVLVSGLDKVPKAGELLYAFNREDHANELLAFRQKQSSAARQAPAEKVTLEDLYKKMKSAALTELKFVLKADVQGSVEVVKQTIEKLSTAKIRMNVIYSAPGAISASDVNLASASNAILIGFNIRPDKQARELVKSEDVDLRLYNVIYELSDDLKKAMVGKLEPVFKEVVIGRAEVRKVFNISKIGTIAGCAVTEGKVTRKAEIRLLRDDKVIFSGKLASLRRLKNDAKEVLEGFECGMSIEKYNDIKEGDVIEAFVMEEVAQTI